MILCKHDAPSAQLIESKKLNELLVSCANFSVRDTTVAFRGMEIRFDQYLKNSFFLAATEGQVVWLLASRDKQV